MADKTGFSRSLRRLPTDAEAALWRLLRCRRLGVKFRRQHPIGPFVVDFCCVERRLVVELDGGQHVGAPSDERRTAWLERRGYLVTRYWNDDVLARTAAVVADILRATKGL